MSLSHLGNLQNNAANYKNLPANSIYCPAVSTGFVLSSVTGTSTAAATFAPSVSQFVNGIVVTTGAGSTAVMVPPAASLYAYCVSQGVVPTTPGSPGDGFDFRIVNSASTTSSIVGNTDSSTTLTLGTANIITTASKTFKCVFTTPTAITIFG